jgi:hypothetical protein
MIYKISSAKVTSVLKKKASGGKYNNYLLTPQFVNYSAKSLNAI